MSIAIAFRGVKTGRCTKKSEKGNKLGRDGAVPWYLYLFVLKLLSLIKKYLSLQ